MINLGFEEDSNMAPDTTQTKNLILEGMITHGMKRQKLTLKPLSSVKKYIQSVSLPCMVVACLAVCISAIVET